MEKVGIKPKVRIGFLRYGIFGLLLLAFVISCASKAPKYFKIEQLKQNQEFEQTVKIVVPDESAPGAVVVAETTTTTLPAMSVKERKSGKKLKKGKAPVPKAVESEVPTRRQPELESEEGFAGRRPVIDPFRVGEKLVYSVNYFKVSAGQLTLENRPYAQVNGRKNYQFRTSIKTSALFSSFYSVDDVVDVLMDFEHLVPSVFALHVKETSQLREGQMFFDHGKEIATYWEKKVVEKSGEEPKEETKKQEWEIQPYSQNVFSAAFYLRFFHWEVGKENAFRVANDKENLVFKAKALRKEKLSTDAGEFDAIVIKPEIVLKGVFKPVGDIFIWLSDDDRKYILRIESKIKIGTLVSEVVEIQPGQ